MNNIKGLLPAIIAILLLQGCIFNGQLNGNSGEGEIAETFISGVSKSVTASENLEIPFMPGDDNSVVIEHMGYTVSYNSRFRIPNWVAYELMDSELYGDFERAEKFVPDPSFKGRQAYDTDYRGSGWDRGHMAPSGDMKWSSQVMKECFYLTNVCPQDHNLNAGLWNDLEKQVRREARYYKRVYVVTGPVVGRGIYGTVGENKVQIPDGFFKALMAPQKNGKGYVSIGFYFPNKSLRGGLADYAMTVDKLEEMIGMDLFYSLDTDLQDAAEAKIDPYGDWRISNK